MARIAFPHRLPGVGMLALVFLAGLGWISGAAAAYCGAGVPCKCGDAVTRSTTLAADLGVCTGIGLRVKTFVDNSLRGNGYFFEAYRDNSGVWTYPHANTVTGGSVENTKTCLRFGGAYDNRVDQLRLDDECQVTMWSLGGQAPTGNAIHTLPLQ